MKKTQHNVRDFPTKYTPDDLPILKRQFTVALAEYKGYLVNSKKTKRAVKKYHWWDWYFFNLLFKREVTSTQWKMLDTVDERLVYSADLVDKINKAVTEIITPAFYNEKFCKMISAFSLWCAVEYYYNAYQVDKGVKEIYDQLTVFSRMVTDDSISAYNKAKFYAETHHAWWD